MKGLSNKYQSKSINKDNLFKLIKQSKVDISY